MSLGHVGRCRGVAQLLLERRTPRQAMHLIPMVSQHPAKSVRADQRHTRRVRVLVHHLADRRVRHAENRPLGTVYAAQVALEQQTAHRAEADRSAPAAALAVPLHLAQQQPAAMLAANREVSRRGVPLDGLGFGVSSFVAARAAVDRKLTEARAARGSLRD